MLKLWVYYFLFQLFSGLAQFVQFLAFRTWDFYRFVGFLANIVWELVVIVEGNCESCVGYLDFVAFELDKIATYWYNYAYPVPNRTHPVVSYTRHYQLWVP
jgi:hypothetical protein